MPYRMKHVAERAGVSVTTVSHVVNKTRHVAPQTRDRVLAAIRDLNFYKNLHAQRLSRGQSNFFGLIVSDIANPFFPEIIKSFEMAALERGCELLLANTNYDPSRTEAAVRKMIENGVRAVAVLTSELGKELAKELAAHQVAVVFLDLGRVGRLVSNIRVDYSAGIFEAIAHLRDLGHQEFVFISGPQSLGSAVTRRQAFVKALEHWGLPSDRTIEGTHKVDGGIAAVSRLLQEPNFPTAILASNDLTAIGALSALDQAGVRVPEQVSVVGFDDIDFARLAHPPLTTVSLSRQFLGRQAFEALDRMLRSKRRRGKEYVVETHLVVRSSTGPARTSKLDFKSLGRAAPAADTAIGDPAR